MQTRQKLGSVSAFLHTVSNGTVTNPILSTVPGPFSDTPISKARNDIKIGKFRKRYIIEKVIF